MKIDIGCARIGDVENLRRLAYGKRTVGVFTVDYYLFEISTRGGVFYAAAVGEKNEISLRPASSKSEAAKLYRLAFTGSVDLVTFDDVADDFFAQV